MTSNPEFNRGTKNISPIKNICQIHQYTHIYLKILCRKPEKVNMTTICFQGNRLTFVSFTE